MTQGLERKALELGEIETFVAEADRLAGVSHAQRNEFLMSRWLPYATPPQEPGGGIDPFGPAYLQWVMRQWQQASGRGHYALDLEHDTNVVASDEQLQRLYPFVSGDTNFIANYMMGVYFALRLLSDAPNRNVVEYGVGWGNTTVALMQAGFNVLAVDIDPKWLSLLKLRAGKLGLDNRLQTLHGQFGELPVQSPPTGGVVFYECFHHALNHDDTLARIKHRIVDGGVLLFAAETIYKGFPQPWGLRLDGHSLWAIRRYGWMELAFSEDYFVMLTRRHNLALQRHELPEAGPFGVVYKAVRADAGVALGRTLLSSTETGFLEPEADPQVLTRFTTGRARLEIPCGAPGVSLELKNLLNVPVRCAIKLDGAPAWDDVVPAGAQVTARLPHTTAGYHRVAEITSDTHVPAALGMNDDPRRLGIAVGRLRLVA